MKFAAFLFILPCLLSADVFYVRSDATFGGDGSSWSSAFKFLQDALDQTVEGRGDKVFIKNGTYYPDEGLNVVEGDRTASFFIKDLVTLYGGFVGTESSTEQRNPTQSETYLSGDIASSEEMRSYHVVQTSAGSTINLDSIVICYGNSNASGAVDWYTQINNHVAAALHINYIPGIRRSSTTINVQSCIFSDNRASYGAVSLGGNWNIDNCLFENNTSTERGGVMYQGSDNANYNVTDSSFINNNCSNLNQGSIGYLGTWDIDNCYFSSNIGSLFSGGTNEVSINRSIFLNNSSQQGSIFQQGINLVYNSVFVGNAVTRAGGIAYNADCTFVNCTFLDNRGVWRESSPRGASIAYYCDISVYNCIFTYTENTFERQDMFNSMKSMTDGGTKNIISGGMDAFSSGTYQMQSANIIDVTNVFIVPEDFDGPDGVIGNDDDGLNLKEGTLAIGLGDSSYLTPKALLSDVTGRSRLNQNTLDLGAYEFVPTIPVITSIGSFYESQLGSSVVVSSVEQEYLYRTYQWYLNDTPIPAVFGGTNSSFSILGDPSSEGTWRVEVTNDAGTASAEFEYRVFSDADSDGYSDYRELNILGTNPNNADTDGDGLSDYDELETHGTQPTLVDSNSDGFGDGVIFNAGLSLSSDYSALSQDLLSRQKDLRIGSKISSVANDIATLQVVLEESEDLDSWTERQTIDLSVPLQDGETTKFFRYKMTD